LPERLRSTVAKRMRAADHADSVLDAEAQLTALAGRTSGCGNHVVDLRRF
jgi:hypothetical protein